MKETPERVVASPKVAALTVSPPRSTLSDDWIPLTPPEPY
jgi:hypothetical protein